jgi:lipopolysaccharide transport system ATP-binding protein
LRDVSFSIPPSQVTGVIGRNGAGKSTLLKLLSRITQQTAGEIILRGRVASLLEVGTGFHPDLTGRENVFLNGAILGMSKAEIRRKLDDIVGFAEVERFIDTPVKRYSSGMYVRLAFAVAAYLEPEILIIDEVLAVGDTAFQQRCIARMLQLVREGRSMLVVSHNMGVIRQLAAQTLVLDRGSVVYFGETSEAISKYENAAARRGAVSAVVAKGPLAGSMQIERLEVFGSVSGVASAFLPAEQMEFRVDVGSRDLGRKVRVNIGVATGGVRLCTMADLRNYESIPPAGARSIFRIPPDFLRPGVYSLSVGLSTENTGDEWLWAEDCLSFEISAVWNEVTEKAYLGLITPHFPSTREAR